MTRKLRFLGMAAALALLAGPAFAETVKLTFVTTNDIDRMEADDGRGGFAKLAAVVKAERAKGPAFLVHAGDTISPSLLSGIDKGAHVIDILNQMNVDVMVPGNHEFDFGPDIFVARIGEAKFPIVSSNVKMKDGAAPANTVDQKIVDVSGVKVGFYGLTTEETPAVSSPGDITFASSLDTAAAKSKALREAGADIVVAVTHEPIDVDMAMVRSNVADLIIAGHDEHLLTYYNGRTALTESYSQADYVVVVDLLVDKETKDGKTTVSWRPEFRVIDTINVEEDAEIAAVVKGYSDKLDAELNVEIGVTETALDSRRATVRGQESAVGNLIADAMREAVGADVAITNGGGIRADKEYAAGSKLTRRDVLSELPFGNKTVKLELSGKDLRAAIENGLSQFETGAGRFPQVSGVVIEADVTKPAGERVTAITVGGAPLDEAKTYVVATNDFMANGGDGYVAFRNGKQVIDPVDATLMASQVIDYIALKKTVAPKVEGRIVLKQ